MCCGCAIGTAAKLDGAAGGGTIGLKGEGEESAVVG